MTEDKRDEIFQAAQRYIADNEIMNEPRLYSLQVRLTNFALAQVEAAVREKDDLIAEQREKIARLEAACNSRDRRINVVLRVLEAAQTENDTLGPKTIR